MNLMELKNVSSDMMSDVSSIQRIYIEIARNLELISDVIAIQNPSYHTKIQTIINKIYTLNDQLISVSNQCSDSIMRYANDSGEVFDKLSADLNKVNDHITNILM